MKYESFSINVKEIFIEGKCKKFLLIECPQCNKDFKKHKAIADHLLRSGKNNKLFCSIKCSAKYNTSELKKNNKVEYDKTEKKLDEGICRICQKECAFDGPAKGYKAYCSKNCYYSDRSRVFKKYSLDKFGTENPFQSEEIKNKIKTKMIEKYGCENVSQAKEIKDLKKKRSLDRYGVEHVLQAKEVMDKVKQTNLERYGVENVMHDPEIAALAALNGGGRATSKYYTTKFGTQITIQGSLEQEFVDLCEKNDILIENGPFIYYNFEGRKRKYFMDFKVKINESWKLIEIKSCYWYEKMKKEVEAKKRAAQKWCKKNGYEEYVLMIDDVYVPYERGAK